jgi:hypothetical protein
MALDAPLDLGTFEATTHLNPWETALIPADVGRIAFTPAPEPTGALIVRVQPDLTRLREDAAKAGLAQTDLDGFFAQFA